MSRLNLFLLSAAVGIASASSAFAADAKAEITIAAQHAALAASASDLAGVRMHLHHALNCLEGPGGTDFSKTEMNPCQNAGSGAIPDSSDPVTNATLHSAVTKAVTGLNESTLQAAQADASSVAATLKSIK